jgi:LuxR family maltose regulon positive regulatory protein
LAATGEFVRQRKFVHRMPEVAAAQVLVLIRQGDVAEAARIAQTHDLPVSRARVCLAQGDPSAALAALEPWRRQAEAREWQDERLKAMVLESIALDAHGDRDQAVQRLAEALALAEPGGFIRLFVDEGPPMAELLSEAAARGILPDYAGRLLSAFEIEGQRAPAGRPASPGKQAGKPAAGLLIEPLSERELRILQLVAQGLSNRAISERLFLALSTVKGHNRNIFDKLQVASRTEAVARARELGLL